MSHPTTSHQPTGYRRHPLEIAPLVFGLVFLGIATAWGLLELGVVSTADTAWILPIVLVGAGALGVVLALTKPRRIEARQADVGYADHTAELTHTVDGGTSETDTTDTDTTDTGSDAGTRERHDD